MICLHPWKYEPKNQIIEPEDNQPDLEAVKQSPAPLILFKLTGKLIDNSKNNAQGRSLTSLDGPPELTADSINAIEPAQANLSPKEP